MFNKIYEKLKSFIKENIKFIISLLIIIVVFNYELPCAIYIPGGEVNLKDRINVENGYESKGELGMAYVSMVKSSLPFVLLSFVMPDWDLQKESDVVYEDTDMDETIEIDKVYMKQAKDNAIVSAYSLANKTVEIKSKDLKVIYIQNKAKTDLKINDTILSVNDNLVSSLNDIKNSLKDLKENDVVEMKIIRNGKEKKIKSTLIKIDDEVKLGIGIIETYDYTTDPKIEIESKERESGASGGLMMSLAIYNSLVKEDITNGNKIIGTGTIDSEGNVGEIDGVKYKLLGATRKKADIFLCPVENYDEAIKVKKDKELNIKIIKVNTLKEAVEKLEEN